VCWWVFGNIYYFRAKRISNIGDGGPLLGVFCLFHGEGLSSIALLRYLDTLVFFSLRREIIFKIQYESLTV
jgi:hypothetical protein